MAAAVYIVCTLTSALCAWLLLRGYGRTKTALLLWSGLCFVGLTFNNALVFVDLIVIPQISLILLRNAAVLASVVVLVVGLVWESPVGKRP